MTTVLEFGGGLENYLINTAKELHKRYNLNIKIVTMDNDFSKKINNILGFYYFKKTHNEFIFKESSESLSVRLNGIEYIKCKDLNTLKQQLKDADIIYSKNEILESFILKFLIGYNNLPKIIFGCHTALFYPITKTIQSKLHNFLYGGLIYKFMTTGVYGFHVLNSSDESRIKNIYGKKKRIWYIPNPIDVNLLVSQSQKFQYELENTNTYNIVWIARMNEQKGVEDLVSIIEAVNLKYKNDIFWNIIGDGEDRYKFDNLIKSNGNIKLYGHVQNIYIPNILKQSDLFITTSKWEGHPINLLESQAMDLFAIGYDIPGVNSIIINGKTGFLVSDIGEFVDKLGSLLGKRNENLGISESIKERFGPDMIYGNLKHMFDEI